MSELLLKQIKRNKYLLYLAYKLKDLNISFLMSIFHFTKIDPKKVVFSTSNGRFNDNCSPVAKLLHESDKSVKIIWGYKNPQYLSDFPDYITPVKYGTLQYYKEMSSASVWVYNYLIPNGTIKKKKQLYIQLWHGDKGIKRFAYDATNTNKNYSKTKFGRKYCENELCDLFFTGSKAFIEIWKRSTGYTGKVMTIGTPRCDQFFDKSIDTQAIKDKFSIPKDTSVLLYAPTFRDHCSHEKVSSDIDLPLVLELLQKKYNRKWVCLKRSHSGAPLVTDKSNDQNNIIDTSSYIDIGDLMLISDLLITDYSSCAGDFPLLHKPVILYQDDITEYTEKDRAFLWDIDEFPFFVAYNMKELENIIDQMSDSKTEKNSNDINSFYQTCETGKASLGVVNEIIKHQKKINQ